MKLKKKEDQNVDASVLFRRENKTGKNTRSNRGAGTEDLQRLPHLENHPICSHQTQALFLMPRSVYWQEPNTNVSSEALSET